MADLPYLKITLTGSDGTKPPGDVLPPLTINIPRELSLRVASMHVLDYLFREWKKKKKLDDALKAIGCK